MEEVARRANVGEDGLLSLERGSGGRATKEAIALVSRALDLPVAKVMSLADLTNPTLRAAATQFAKQVSGPERLSPSERDALSDFVRVLAEV